MNLLNRNINLVDTLYNASVFLLAFSLSFPMPIKGAAIIFLSLLACIKIIIDYNQFSIVSEFSFNKPSIYFLLFFLLKVFSLFYLGNFFKSFNVLEKELSFLVFPIALLPLSIKDQVNFKKKLYYSFSLGVLITLLYSYFSATKYFIHRLPTLNFYDCFELTFMYQNFAGWTGSHAGYLSIFIIVGFFMMIDLFHPKYNLKSYHLRFNYVIIFVFILALIQLLSVTPFFIFVSLLFFFFKIQNNRKIFLFIVPFIALILSTFILYKSKLFVQYFYIIPLFVTAIFLLFKLCFSLSFKNAYKIFFSLVFIIPIILFITVDSSQALIDFIYYNPNNLAYRYWNWKFAIDLISDNLWIGTGTIAADLKLASIYIQNGLSEISHFNEHNQYLRFGIEMGIIGLLAFSSLIIRLITDGMKTQNFVYFAIILSFIIFSITESIFLRHYGIIFFTFTLIILNKLNVENK
jgi:hypothetical protein